MKDYYPEEENILNLVEKSQKIDLFDFLVFGDLLSFFVLLLPSEDKNPFY